MNPKFNVHVHNFYYEDSPGASSSSGNPFNFSRGESLSASDARKINGVSNRVFGNHSGININNYNVYTANTEPKKSLYEYSIKDIKELNLTTYNGDIEIDRNYHNERFYIKSTSNPTLEDEILSLNCMNGDITVRISANPEHKVKLNLTSFNGDITTKTGYKLPYGGELTTYNGKMDIFVDQERVYLKQMYAAHGRAVNNLNDSDNHENKLPLTLKNMNGDITVR